MITAHRFTDFCDPTAPKHSQPYTHKSSRKTSVMDFRVLNTPCTDTARGNHTQASIARKLRTKGSLAMETRPMSPSSCQVVRSSGGPFGWCFLPSPSSFWVLPSSLSFGWCCFRPPPFSGVAFLRLLWVVPPGLFFNDMKLNKLSAT